LPGANLKFQGWENIFQAAVINDFCACLLCLFNLFRKTFLSPACIAALCSYYQQIHYIEVAQGDIFMEQKMRFGLVLGRLAILKKKLGANF
jgi:hypothetical protein